MNTTKRITAGILAISTVITLTSCGKPNSQKTNEPQTADKVMQKAYAAVEMDVDLPLRSISSIFPLGDSGSYLVTGYSDEDGEKMYVTDTEFLDFTPIDFSVETEGNAESYYSASALPDGTILMNVSVTDYGDTEIPDWDDPDFDYDSFDFEAFYAAAQRTYSLYTLDRDGNILSENEITGVDKLKADEDSELYIGEITPIGENLIIRVGGMDGESYYTIGTDGALGEKLDLGDNAYLYNAGCDSEGNLVFNTWDDSGEVIKTVDAQTLKLRDDVIKLKDLDVETNIQMITAGTGDYTLYLSTNNSLYGMKSDGSTEEVINWTDSDLNGDYITSLIPLENEDFIILERNWNSGGDTAVYRLTKRDVSELANTKVITLLAEYANNDVTDMVRAFNQSHTDYRIKLEDYSKYYEYDEETHESINDPENQLKMDIAAGKTFDMVILSGNSALYQNLASKGMFTDLYEYLGKNGSASKDEFLPNVLKACEKDGKLLCISPTFNVSTYAIKKKFTDKTSWTFDEMMEVYNQHSDTMRLLGNTDKKETFYTLYRNMNGGFIDYNKGTCSFDSPEFVKMLELIDGMDLETEHDWESMTDEDYDAYYKDRETAMLNDKVLLSEIYFYDIRQYTRARYGTIGDEITLIGAPTNSGNGAQLTLGNCFAITASSPSKDACWEFLSQYFTDDYYGQDNVWNLPSVETYLDKCLDEAMEDPYWIDQDGKKQTYEDISWIAEKEIKIPNLTKEERDMIKEYLLSADSSGTYSYDETIYKIIDEEVEAFFNGERSAKETADILQNRISILVSEQS